MIGVNLLLVVVLGQAPVSPADAGALVSKLGAKRYAEREAATAALERIGRQALPALRLAANARDPEIRTRASALVDKIEGALLTQATMVRLDFQDQTTADIAKSIGDQANLRLALIPEGLPAWRTLKISLKESAPLPFWQAIDRFCAAANLQYHFTTHGYGAARESAFPLYYSGAGGGRPAGPICDQGPFRVQLVSLRYQRDVNFQAAGRFAVSPPVVAPPPAPARIPAPSSPRTAITEQFYAQIQVVAEPRLSLAQSGPLRLLEAIDDQGQSLIAPSTGQRESGYNTLPQGSMLPIQAYLIHPRKPSTLVKKLRGTLPVHVTTRKPNPLTVSISASSGKTFHNDDVTLSVHEIKVNPVTNQTILELSIRNTESQVPMPEVPGAEFTFQRPERQAQQLEQLEIVDAQGRILRWYPSGSDPESSRQTLTIAPDDPAMVPSQIRYYGLARASTEVDFAFVDVPMP